ncbi:MAG: rhamnogalacturonan acetylesterase [bacterium]
MRAQLLLIPIALLSSAVAPRPITVYLAGDSTMAEKAADKRPETGWGEKLGQYFRPDDVRIANRAMNGRSTRTFIAEGRWQAIADSLVAGDYVFIQFGHNDESPAKVGSYTPPDDFKRNLTRMVADVRAKGAFPVLFTPVQRRRFNDEGRLEDTHGDYPGYTRSVAAELKVPLIDMLVSSGEVLSSFGADSSTKLFLQLEPGAHPNYPQGVKDNTHFNPFGAELMARLAVDGIKALRIDLASHFKGSKTPAMRQ